MGEKMKLLVDLNLIEILDNFRKQRDEEQDVDIRHHYNEVCDRLEVLVSKILEKRAI